MRHFLRSLPRACVLLTLASPPAAAGPIPPFALETVDSAGFVGTHTSLVLDGRGDPRIAYFDDTADDVRYAAKRSGAWTVEIADATGSVGQYASLALDASGLPRIAYYSVSGNDLKIATRGASSWSVETIEGSDAVGLYASLALTPGGAPALAYYDATTGDLHYAVKKAGVWAIDIADSPGDVGLFASLVFDGLGNPRIAHFDEGGDNLRYSAKIGTLWSSEAVDLAGDVGRYCGIAVDGSGVAHVSYYDASLGDLKYARRDGVGWTIETVDSAGTQGLYTSIRLDVLGQPRIAYFDNSANDLKYAVRSGGTWSWRNIDVPGIVGAYASLALDGRDVPSISYTDAVAADLRFASAGLHVASPVPGAVWPVGSEQTVRWTGAGAVDLSLSADGGATWIVIEGGLTRNARTIRVPHLPTRFARLRVERSDPFASAETDSFFRIDATVTLLDLTAIKREDAVRVAWRTEPAPPVLSGYVLERSSEGTPGWTRLHDGLLTAGEFEDQPNAGARYRLTAVNGLGENTLLGEAGLSAALAPGGTLLLYPNPAGEGGTRVLFRVTDVSGRGAARTELFVRDLAGRTVKRIDAGALPEGTHELAWDGRDAGGRRAPSGVYLIELLTEGLAPRRTKLVLAR